MQYRHKLRNVTGAHKISYSIIIAGYKTGEKWREFIKSLLANEFGIQDGKSKTLAMHTGIC